MIEAAHICVAMSAGKLACHCEALPPPTPPMPPTPEPVLEDEAETVFGWEMPGRNRGRRMEMLSLVSSQVEVLPELLLPGEAESPVQTLTAGAGLAAWRCFAN